ncbi:MAG: hypothetical protein FWD02_02970 [Bacteroidales bacterium]|nr:hypothetical protein [Bacteroidales bacterium]
MKTTYNLPLRPIIPLGMIRSVARGIHRRFRIPLGDALSLSKGLRPNSTMVAFLRNAEWIVDTVFLPSDASRWDAGVASLRGRYDRSNPENRLLRYARNDDKKLSNYKL